MLADREDRTLEALKSRLGHEQVDVALLTTDAALLQTLRAAVPGARQLRHVATGDKVGDLLLASDVGILIIDVAALLDSASTFIGQIKKQFPDLVIVVAGSRDDETALARFISGGFVYRFMHKPVSPGRARLFVDTAVKKYAEQVRRRPPPPRSVRTPRLPRAMVLLGTLGAILLFGITFWLWQRNEAHQASLAARAARLAGEPKLSPPSPDTPAATNLIDARERLLARAENALLQEHLDDAASAIETARLSGAEPGRVAFLSAQLVKARERVKVSQTQSRARVAAAASAALAKGPVTPDAPVTPGVAAPGVATPGVAAPGIAAPAAHAPSGDDARSPKPQALAVAADNDAAPDVNSAPAAAPAQAAPASPEQLLRNANERLLQDRLIEPANDSAKYYLQTLKSLDPQSPALVPSMQDFGNRLIAKARRAFMLKQYDSARGWLDEADAMNLSAGDSTALREDIAAAAARAQWQNTFVPMADLKLKKTVAPDYPPAARKAKLDGWVDLDFTIDEKGGVRDISVHADSTPILFDEAAVKAASQWRYEPVRVDGKPIARRARVRVTFNLKS